MHCYLLPPDYVMRLHMVLRYDVKYFTELSILLLLQMNLISADVENAAFNWPIDFQILKFILVVLLMGVFYPIYLVGSISLVGIGVLVLAVLSAMVSSAGGD